MQAVRRSVQHEMKFFRNGADPLQGAPQQSGKMHSQSRFVEAGSLERGFMITGENPSFIGNSRSVRTKRQIIVTCLDDAQGLPLFLLDNVAEYATLFGEEVFPARAQFVKYA